MLYLGFHSYEVSKTKNRLRVMIRLSGEMCAGIIWTWPFGVPSGIEKLHIIIWSFYPFNSYDTSLRICVFFTIYKWNLDNSKHEQFTIVNKRNHWVFCYTIFIPLNTKFFGDLQFLPQIHEFLLLSCSQYY